MTDHDALIKELRDCIERECSRDGGAASGTIDAMMKAADMLKALSGPGDAEPVAWRYEIANIKEADGTYSHWEWKISAVKPCVPEGAMRNLQGLYLRRPVEPVATGLPQDVINLVVAARKVAFSVSDFVRSSPASAQVKNDELVKIVALDRASEAFASRVPWDDAPVDHEAALNVSQPESVLKRIRQELGYDD